MSNRAPVRDATNTEGLGPLARGGLATRAATSRDRTPERLDRWHGSRALPTLRLSSCTQSTHR